MAFDPDYAANVFRQLARDKAGTTLIFGAGQRTVEALQSAPNAARRAIDAIIDDNPSRIGQTVLGLPVRAPADFTDKPVARIAICSEMFERELTQRAIEHFGDSIAIITTFDRRYSLASTLSTAQQAVQDDWNATNDREALWLVGDRLMSELHARLAATPEWRYGPLRQLDEFQQLCEALGGAQQLRGRSLLSAGCGRYHPLGQSILALLAGAERTIALDLEPPLDEVRTARATAELVGHLLLDPMPLGLTRAELLARLEPLLDLAALQQGSLSSAIRRPDALELRIDSVTNLQASETARGRGFDVITSRDVFEHVHDIPALLSAVHEQLNPAGTLIAWIDFSDHRRYANPLKFAHWSSLTDEHVPTPASGSTNGLRFPDYAELFNQAGFSVLRYEPTEIEPVPAHVRPQLAPIYREMKDADLAVCRAIAVLEKKASRSSWGRCAHQGDEASSSKLSTLDPSVP